MQNGAAIHKVDCMEMVSRFIAEPLLTINADYSPFNVVGRAPDRIAEWLATRESIVPCLSFVGNVTLSFIKINVYNSKLRLHMLIVRNEHN